MCHLFARNTKIYPHDERFSDGKLIYGFLNPKRTVVTVSGLDPSLDCPSRIRIPSTVTLPDSSCCKVVAIADNAFEGNETLREINLTGNIVSIGRKAFQGCRNLDRFDIGACQIEEIGEECFSDSQISFMLPESVRQIGRKAFHNSYPMVFAIPKEATRIEGALEECYTKVLMIESELHDPTRELLFGDTRESQRDWWPYIIFVNSKCLHQNQNGMLLERNDTLLTCVPIDMKHVVVPYGVEIIAENAINESVEEITIPDSVDEWQDDFERFWRLKKVNVRSTGSYQLRDSLSEYFNVSMQ